MDDRFNISHGLDERLAIGEVHRRDLHVEAVELAGAVGVGSNLAPYAIPTVDEALDDVRADPSGCAGDEYVHAWVLSLSRCLRYLRPVQRATPDAPAGNARR